jgi:hypothetical protein
MMHQWPTPPLAAPHSGFQRAFRLRLKRVHSHHAPTCQCSVKSRCFHAIDGNSFSFIPTRNRWQKVLHPELIKGPWTKEEDETVLKLVQRCASAMGTDARHRLPGDVILSQIACIWMSKIQHLSGEATPASKVPRGALVPPCSRPHPPSGRLSLIGNAYKYPPHPLLCFQARSNKVVPHSFVSTRADREAMQREVAQSP